jgi:hypothetical protein
MPSRRTRVIPTREERARRIAWVAIKRSYVKVVGSRIGRERT